MTTQPKHGHGERTPTLLGRLILQLGNDRGLSTIKQIAEAKPHIDEKVVSGIVFGEHKRGPQEKTLRKMAEKFSDGNKNKAEDLYKQFKQAQTSEFTSFVEWVKRDGMWHSLICLGACLLAVIPLVLFLTRPDKSNYLITLHAIHALAVLILAFIIHHDVSKITPESNLMKLSIAQRASSDFGLFIILLGVSWFFLYIMMIAKTAGKIPEANWIINLPQNLGSAMLLMAYSILATNTMEERKNEAKGTIVRSSSFWRIMFAVVVLTVAVTVCEYIFGQTNKIFYWISGSIQGIALALVIGRLDTKYVDPPPLVVILLYTYAVIQNAWPAFKIDLTKEKPILTNEEACFTAIALLLKCVFFLVVAWILRTGILVYYTARIRTLHGAVVDDRATWIFKYQTQKLKASDFK